MDWYQFPRSHTAKLDEHNTVQRKTFIRWIVSQLETVNLHLNIVELSDLRDGVTLIALLVILSGEQIAPEKGTMRLHRLANVRKALAFLSEQQVKLVNIRAEDIVDGNIKLTQSLIWQIISHFYLPSKEILLQWARVAAADSGVEIRDFTAHSWKDGAAFLAIIRRFRPDLLYGVQTTEVTGREALEKAFDVAQQAGVARLLDAADFESSCLDERSIMTYVAAFYKTFQQPTANGTHSS